MQPRFKDQKPGDRDLGGPASGAPLRLSQVVPEARFIACDDLLVSEFTDRVDSCRIGDVFVARLGPAGDGHDDVPRAVAAGARGVIAERMVATGGVPLCLVPSTDEVLGRLAQAWAGDPSRRLRLTIVTGASGKTTTAWLTAAALAETGVRVGVLSDLGCLGCDDPLPVEAEYGSAISLAAWLARLVHDGCQHAVVEVSDSMLANRVLAGVRCDTLVLTNLGSTVADGPGKLRAWVGRAAQALQSLPADGWLVSGVGPRRLDRLRRHLPRTAGCLTVGLAAGYDLRADPIERGLFGRTVLARHGGQLVPLSLTSPVAAFAKDALLAAAVAVRHGIPLDVAVRGIEAAGSLPGRCERIDRGQDAAVFLDSPTSGHALSTTLASLRRLTPGRLAVVAETPLVARLGRRRFASLAAACDDVVVVPTDLLAAAAGPRTVAAYARIDRLLGRLGRGDCLLAVGAPAIPAPGLALTDRFPLAAVVEGWLTLAGRDASRAGQRAA